MKKRLYYLCSLFILLTIVSCQKEGPPGVQGLQGVQGSPGKDGQDAHVKIFVKDFKVATQDWRAEAGSEYASLNVNEITNEVITGGFVLVYMIMEDQLFMLPCITGYELFRHSFGLGKVTIWREPADRKNVGKPLKDRHFRIAIIPSAISGSKKSSKMPDLISIQHLNDIDHKVLHW